MTAEMAFAQQSFLLVIQAQKQPLPELHSRLSELQAAALATCSVAQTKAAFEPGLQVDLTVA